jgi:hypothetical protein
VKQMDLTRDGSFGVGVNYWASHAGTRMWADWRPDVVRRDLARLARGGLEVLRVFPLWPDFQPLTALRTPWQIVEFRHGETPLPDDPAGRAGLSAEALAHFREFLDLAQQRGFRCIVGLLTGWMSGRLFVPPALEGLNVLTDPAALRWEVRFVREMVRAFRDHSAVLAWDLGNECNCMGTATRDQAYAWTATIAAAIRAEDRAHPVVSGMHGMSPVGAWTIEDQGELTDLLTTHPYPVFTPHCDQDPVGTIRSILHSTAESNYYADLGGKPCLCEEIGTLGPMIADERTAAAYVRGCLFSLWANGARGLLWWCAHDQDGLDHAPYDWYAVERELGLLRRDGRPKPVFGELARFRRLLARLPVRELPARSREAVCILTQDQDHWGVAYAAFVLAKQAGFDLEFQHESQPLKDAPLYLLPSLKGHRMLSRRRLIEVQARVRAGATLYLSLDDGLPSGFEGLIGLEPTTRERRRETAPLALDGVAAGLEVPCAAAYKVNYRPTKARVLGREADGNPAFTECAYGKGRVFFLSVPLEMHLTQTPGAFHAADAPPCWKVYAHVAGRALAGRAVRKTDPLLALTEHRLSPRRRVVVAVNQGPARLRDTLTLKGGWRLARVLYGTARGRGPEVALTLAPNDGGVMVFERR